MLLGIRVLITLPAVFLAGRSAEAGTPKGPQHSRIPRSSDSSCSEDNGSVVACFLESRAAHRLMGGRFTIDEIDGSLCTHVVYCYADLNEDTNRLDVTGKVEDFKRLQTLKERNPNLKITIATGGWDQGSVRYSKMVASRATRAAFVSSVVELLSKYWFDGFNIDWRDPGDRGGTSEDKANYVQLCKELKEEFRKHGWQLTVVVTGMRHQLDLGYDLPGLFEHTNYFYVLTYDYHGAWDGFMGHTAPLFPRVEESGAQRELNVNFTVTTILSRGIPANKLVIGITFYAYIYHYADINKKGFGARTVWKNDFTGPYTKDPIKMGYNELCEMLETDGRSWTRSWQDDHQVPYVSMNDIGISYDNERSIDVKINYAKSLGLRGTFIVAVNLDDFSGRCGEGRYPLLTQIKDDISDKTALIDQVVACFFESHAARRPPGGRFTVDDIDGSLCTHVVYCYTDLNEETNRIDVTGRVEDYRRLQALKERNPSLKITVATGGWDQGSVRYSKMVATRTARAAFVSSVVELLSEYRFDGFDIDWRDPGDRGGTSEDKANYVQLCKELKEEFRKHGWQLTVVVTGRRHQLDLGYDLPGLAEHTNYFYVLTYDYHGAWDGFMGHTAPLYPRDEESGAQRELNVNFSVTTILSHGIPAYKVVIGITLYGYIYHYADINQEGFGARTVWKNDFTGPFSKDPVKMGYNELCEMLQSEGQFWTQSWQVDHQVPYVSRDGTSISYDNERSIDAKINFAESLGLRGTFVLAVNSDDFSGRCREGRYPLLRQISRKISVISPVVNQGCRDRQPMSAVVACFLESWSASRPFPGQFNIEDINARLCTHVVYCYVGLNQITNRIEVLDGGMTSAGTFKRLQTLKTTNPNLKVTVAIGGSSESSVKYSNMAASARTRSIFISSVVEFLREHQLDGLDFDWRFPAVQGGRSQDKRNYVLLCKVLKQELQKHGWQLTVTLNSRLHNLNIGYDLKGLAQHTDYFYLLTYEYHGSWESFTGHSSPLYPRPGETNFQQQLNVNYTVWTILARGVPASKLVMGIFLYGPIYRLKNSSNTMVGAPTISNDKFIGPYSNGFATVGYNEVCDLLNSEGVRWTLKWDAKHNVTYIFRDDIWISFESEKSISLKMDVAEALNLRGAFIWAVDSDDFRGHCGADSYPLLTQVHNRMKVVEDNGSAPEKGTAPIVTCFLESWSVYRPSFGQFNIENIDVNLCTHIIYCFAGLDEKDDTIVNIDPDYVRLGAYQRLLELKKKKPDLVVTVSIGGYAEGSVKYSDMSANRQRRRTFIASVVTFLRDTGFDGIDLAWDSPAHRGGRPEDKRNFVLLCKEIRNAFKSTGWRFTVSVSGQKEILIKGYDLPAIANLIDLLHLLAYDYHGPWKRVTGHPSPLKPIARTEGNMEDSVTNSVDYVMARSVPAEKILLVVNLFGRTFILKDASNHRFGAPTNELGFAGPFSQSQGYIGFNELCEKITEEEPSWTLEVDPERGLPYMYKDDKWIAYDDVSSTGEKASAAKAWHLAGVGVWAVSTDDFRGHCGVGKFPLLTEINRALGRIVPSTEPPPPFNVTDTSGTWCSLAEQHSVAVEVLRCGLSMNRDCIVDNEVPPQTVIIADCWKTTAILMICLPDGFWFPMNDFSVLRDAPLTTNSDKMKLLCQPEQPNSFICGRRPRYQKTTRILDLGSFYEPKLRWPWVVELYKDNVFACTATIVSVNYLLTAAHCVTTSRETSTDPVEVDKLIVQIIGDFEPRKVNDIQLHPNYQSETKKLLNDIAMLRLSEPLIFHTDLYPACVHYGDKLLEQTAVAFNHIPNTESIIKYTDILQTMDERCTKSSRNCSRILATSGSQFCGLSLDGMSHLESGSSGGPFLQDLSSKNGDEQWTVTGVVSYSSESSDCLLPYTIYTAVNMARGWIMGLSQRLEE